MPANWRLLEDEIVRIARHLGHEVDEDRDSDKIILDGNNVNITELAKELSERVEVKGGKS